MEKPKRITPRKKVKLCMISLVNFYTISRKKMDGKEPFLMSSILTPLLHLLKEVAEIEDLEESKRKIYFSNCEFKDDQDDCFQVNMNDSKFEITKSHIESMVSAIDELKRIVAMNSFSVDDGGDFIHFKLLAEERIVRTNLLYNGNTEENLHLNDIEKNLRKNALQSMDNGQSEIEHSSQVQLHSEYHRFFSLNPISTFGRQILRCKYEQDGNKSHSMLIPEIRHDSWLNLGTINASIFVHYQLIFGDFKKVKICKSCSKMFHEARTDTDYCCKKCRQLGWINKKDNDTYDMIKCRERQKQYFNYGEEKILQWLKEDCVGCSRIPLPAGGECTRWNDKFGEEEIEQRINKRNKP